MDHENSQQAREFLRTYVNGNRKLITDWLDGSGNAEDVGSHLLCILLERPLSSVMASGIPTKASTVLVSRISI